MIAVGLTRAAEVALPAVPAALDRPISELTGTVAYLAAARARRAVRANLAVIGGPHVPARHVFVNQVRHYLEIFRLLRLRPEQLLRMIDVHGWPHLAEAHAKGKGVILASAHLGPVTVCGQIVAARGIDVAVLVETKSGDMGRLVDRARGAMGVRTVDARSIMGVARTLRSGGVIGVIADRPVTGVGERVTFFGREALIPSAHVVLALRTGAALVPAFGLREGSRLSASMEPELVLERTGDREEDVRRGVQRWAGILERQIARAPAQWSVFEPFWERPPGAQTEALRREPKRRGRAPGPDEGVPPTEGRNGKG